MGTTTHSMIAELSVFSLSLVFFLLRLTFVVVRKVGRRRGHVSLLLLLSLLLRQVCVCVMVTQARTILVTFSTY